MLKTTVKLGLALGSMCICCAGQSDTHLHFEVASIKPVPKESAVKNREYGGVGSSDPGRIIWTRISLHELVSFAFPKYFSHISGPDSLDSAYAITALIPPGTTEDQFNQMLGNLLIERFGLRFHVFTKEVTGYNLVVARSGAKLTPSPPADASATQDTTDSLSHVMDSKGFVVLPPGAKFEAITTDGIDRLTFKNSSMAYFAYTFSLFFTRRAVPIVDKTGLDGEFDFHLEYDGLPPPEDEPRHTDLPPDLRMVIPALQKQVGLTLTPMKIMVDYLVVDRVETVPTEN